MSDKKIKTQNSRESSSGQAKEKTINTKKTKIGSGSRRKKALRVSGQAAEMFLQNIMLPRKMVTQIAEEVAKVVSSRMALRKRKSTKTSTKIDNSVFLDTSAIIDMRIFELAKIGAVYGNFVVLESVLLELKNIADSKDNIKKERGRRAMDALDKFRKVRGIKVLIHADEVVKPVDESVIDHAKKHKGRIITCDYNLAKKASISGVIVVNLYELANIVKTTALPGEEFFVKIVQEGKGAGQGVGYLPDGTMLVVEKGREYIGKTVNVEVSRIIQTDSGKILFSKIKTTADR